MFIRVYCTEEEAGRRAILMYERKSLYGILWNVFHNLKLF